METFLEIIFLNRNLELIAFSINIVCFLILIVWRLFFLELLINQLYIGNLYVENIDITLIRKGRRQIKVVLLGVAHHKVAVHMIHPMGSKEMKASSDRTTFFGRSNG